MRRRMRTACLVASLACVTTAIDRGTVAAQQTSTPDISGAWERYGSLFGGPVRSPGQTNDPYLPPPAPPPPLKPQYRNEWQARVTAAREADARGEPLATGYTHCLPDGMPSMMAAIFPIEFLQSPGQVTVIEEAYTQVRRILLDRPQKALEDVEPSFFGHSVGRWEGDTLVVDTIGVKEYIRYQNVPHSPRLRMIERIRLVAPDVLWDEITMEDPVTLEEPWTVTYAYRRMPDYTLLEYICEDNREYEDENGVQRIRIGSPDR
jgi:hypothetical protein